MDGHPDSELEYDILGCKRVEGKQSQAVLFDVDFEEVRYDQARQENGQATHKKGRNGIAAGISQEVISQHFHNSQQYGSVTSPVVQSQ